MLSKSNFTNNFVEEGKAIIESRGARNDYLHPWKRYNILINFFGFKFFTYLIHLFDISDTP